MITVGVDAGAENLKVVLLGNGAPQFCAVIPYSDGTVLAAAREGLDQALKKVGIKESDVNYIVATGVEQRGVSLANEAVSMAFCCVSGVSYLLPSAKTVLDLGADKNLAVRFEAGKVLRTAASGRCAAGTGRFLKMVSNLLGGGVEELGQLSLRSQKPVDVESTCAVFAESEVISLIHQKYAREDIAKGALKGLAHRIYPLLIAVSFEKDVALVGGLAKNIGILKALEDETGFSLLVPSEPLIVGALGAAIIGAHRKGGGSQVVPSPLAAFEAFSLPDVEVADLSTGLD